MKRDDGHVLQHTGCWLNNKKYRANIGMIFMMRTEISSSMKGGMDGKHRICQFIFQIVRRQQKLSVRQ